MGVLTTKLSSLITLLKRDGLGEKDYLDYFITMVKHSASESHIADIL